jgi:hypothetical protein
MANLGDSDISEKGRIVTIGFLTLGSIIATTTLLAATGQWWIYDVLYEQSATVSAALHLALWSGFMFAFSRARPIMRGVVSIARRSLKLIVGAPFFILRVALWLSAAAVQMSLAVPAALLRFVLGPGYDVLRADVLLRLDPWLCRAGTLVRRFDPMRDRITRLRAAITKEQKLRRAYRSEFSEQFSSYREFRAHFDAMGRAEQERKARLAADPFRAACRVLGLPEDGNFSEAAFKARYRDLMKSVHPDVAGPNDRAASVNAASTAIRERKGWS